MNRKLYLLTLVILVFVLALSTDGSGLSAPSAASALTAYYNLIGYEGIGTLGSNLTTNGPTPPVGDYVNTHCRYIDVQNTIVGQYYLRYPLHLPNGANINKVSLRVADFNPTGVLWAYLRSRLWNSRDAGTIVGFTLTSNDAESDTTMNITGLNVNVNNQTTQYWIDVSPTNGTNPGQLCVYGIQVTYTIDGNFLPLIMRDY